MNRHKHSGFTFIELLISTAIFTVALTLTVGTIATYTAEQDRVANENHLQQAARVALDSFRAEIATANGSLINSNLGSLFAPIYDDLDGSTASNSGVSFMTCEKKSVTPPEVCPSKDYQIPLLISSTNVDGAERLAIRRYFTRTVAQDSRFFDHISIFYEEYVFKQKTLGEMCADVESEIYATCQQKYETFSKVPGTSYYPYVAGESKTDTNAVKLTDDSVDISEFKLSGRPVSCLRVPNRTEMNLIKQAYGDMSSIISRYYFFVPLDRGSDSVNTTSTGARWLWGDTTATAQLIADYIDSIYSGSGTLPTNPFAVYSTGNNDDIGKESVLTKLPIAKVAGNCNDYFPGPVLKIELAMRRSRRMVRKDPTNAADTSTVPEPMTQGTKDIVRLESEMHFMNK